MSHIAQYRTNLGAVDRELFLAVMKLVAGKNGGSFSKTIDSDDEGDRIESWHEHELAGAIRTERLPQGLGVYFSRDGKPSFVAETISGETIAALTGQIEHAYKTVAVARALANLGYSTKTEIVPGGLVVKAEKTGSKKEGQR